MKKNQAIEKIINESLDKIMSDRFGKYSKYVIQQRALPDVRDGLKPVQRRILFSMYGLGLFNDKQYKKSARIVGDVIGKYHPHGDSSVYEAMVNMSQWWKMNLPLLDMHGNIGSIDNDPAAAMRYTEVRMGKIAEWILNDIKKQTVSFVPNFDDSEMEPVVLPSIFPNLLVNGSMGIAIGMATNMPPHNLGEIIDATIYRILHPKAPFNDIASLIQGPDFPTGGVIKGDKGIYEAFELGQNQKNKILLFSKYEVYEKDKNKFIEITEIPYGVVKSKLVYDIDLIIQNKEIDGVLEIKDQSDRDGINILITLDQGANERSILSYLFQKTDLKISYNYNNTCIKNNSPKTMGIVELIDAYITHVKDVKTKTLFFDLEKQKLRLEIVLGFIKVSEITDKVIEVIIKSEGSKSGVIENLIKFFDFTKNQATAIAELRLYRLSKTDKEAYLLEKAELEKDIKRMQILLNNENEFNKFIIDQLSQMKLLFTTPRKTKVEEKEFDFSYDETDLIKEEMINLYISRMGYIKRLSQRVVDSNSLDTYALKDDDYLIYTNKVNTLNNLLILTNLGNYIIVPIYKIQESKWKDLGTYLSSFADFRVSEEIVSIIEVSNWDSLVYVNIGTRNGVFKKTLLKDFNVSRLNKAYTAISLAKDDYVVNATLTNGSKDIVIFTENGLASKYSENDVAIYSTKAKGNKGVYLSLDDKVRTFITVDPNGLINMISDDGQIQRFKASILPFIPKNIKGRPYNKSAKKFTISSVSEDVNDLNIIIKDQLGQTDIQEVKQYSVSSNEPRIYHLNADNPEKTSFNIYWSDKATKIEAIKFSKEQIMEDRKFIEEVKQTEAKTAKTISDILARINKNLEEDKKKKI
ncbi:DNA topoisomerase 4 subunit A [Mycoplasma sp. Pen4]|uniref:DNA topoisomerase (ATP-hydrolyzing) n=1 Tax=Mycoplasma sp. Pen4 TaxID=640330 RepID=UPI0016541FCD|nr:DNA topoisomerase (ATP-hydrolyzing) [Mycoplasma sp. Pen4]QNM93624.1 DNA topoisomerase 4 subunit A [Mycoplasma sp. Pen4]